MVAAVLNERVLDGRFLLEGADSSNVGISSRLVIPTVQVDSHRTAITRQLLTDT
jgi:hypothetical protein